jgi:hypothetical protein
VTGAAPKADLVDVAPLREAFLKSGLTLSDVALAAGWIQKHRGKREGGDSSRAARYLGLKPWTTRGNRSFRSHVSYETAVVLARAMNVDPIDVGI